MLKEFARDFVIRSADCDRFGRLAPSQALIIMQEMAGEHAHLLGLGREALLKENAVWVLTRSEVHFIRYPLYLESVRVRTFPGKVRRMLFPRFFIFETADGVRLAAASNYWALMDIRTGNMVLPPIALSLTPDTTDIEPPMGCPSPVSIVDGAEESSLFTPSYTDLDVNGHVNNTRCADWACNLLGERLLKDRPIQTLIVNYNREIKGSEPLTFSLRKNADSFSLRCLRGDLSYVDVGGTLSKAGTLPLSPLAAP